MIVNLQPDGWEIIYHRAHALLAAKVAGRWDFGDRDYRVYETIAAIACHDNLEKEWEEDQLTEAGAPLDFTIDRELELDQLWQHADEALYQGRWVAMLISMHLCFLNAGAQDSDSDLQEFLKVQRQRQERWREELGVDKDTAESNYTFMRWCDRLSLILCQRQVPSGGRKLEITNGPDGRRYSLWRLESGDIGVEPWPFSCGTFTVSVDASHLSQLQFSSNQELNRALRDAPRETLSWTLARSDAAN